MNRETSYEAWMKQEGIPIVEAHGVEDVGELPRKPWARTGGKGGFIQLRGMEGFTGMYVGEIPPAGALNPEKHLYEELIYVLQGNGSTEVWSDNGKTKLHFEWQQGSLFAVPLNCWHRLYNGSARPALFLSATSAPMMMDLLHDTNFIFGCDYIFDQRFDGRADYFFTTDKREERGGFVSWETNFIADARSALVDPSEAKGAGVRITSFDMGGSTLVGHIAEWPVGRYHKAHFHQGGAVLLILRSEGYTLMWPQEAGERPYLAKRKNQVVKVDWREGSVVSPPTGWFHQHFNTGSEKARQLAFRYSGQSGKYLLGIGKALNREGVRTNTREGGTLLEYEDEDPEIRRDYETALKKTGVAMEMPPLAYRGS
ncbi:MAG TPA: cupin domain-containing protein [Candidatus Binatia bacterium]|jgi:oxalate decarboxylase/phosphoglucose isomerase-like protein (cupin superfamily)